MKHVVDESENIPSRGTVGLNADETLLLRNINFDAESPGYLLKDI